MSVPWDTTIKIAACEWRLNENVASTESLFTRKRQVITLAGGTADRWEGVLSTPVLTHALAETLMTWMLIVGKFGQFTIGDPDYSGPASGESNGQVDGGAQSGTSLDVKGFTPSTPILAAGEYFQVGNELKRVVNGFTADGSGQGTIEFRPALRTSPADSAAVIIQSPVLLAHLLNDPAKATDQLKMGTFNIAFAEVVG